VLGVVLDRRADDEVADREQRPERLAVVQPRRDERGERRLHRRQRLLGGAVAGDHQRRVPVGDQRPVLGEGALAQPLPPRLALGGTGRPPLVGEQAVGDVVEQRALVGDVPVQRRGADAQLAGEASQRQPLQAHLAEQVHGGVDDGVAGQRHGSSLPSLTL
jgi:hypothetical protein